MDNYHEGPPIRLTGFDFEILDMLNMIVNNDTKITPAPIIIKMEKVMVLRYGKLSSQ